MVRRSLFIYGLLVFALFFMLVMTVYCFTQLAEQKINSDRMRRAQSVYTSLNLGDSNGDDYRLIKSTLKQADLDMNDDGAYYATAEYGRNASQYETRKDIAQKATDAGFKRITGNADDALTPNDTYENGDGDLLRVTIRGKFIQNSLIYGTFESTSPDGSFDLAAHKNETPSYVHTQLTLKAKK